VTVGFVPLRDFNNSCFFNDSRVRNDSNCWFCSVTRFLWWSVLFSYEISMMVIFVSLFFYDISKIFGFVLLRDFNVGRFCSFSRS